MWSRLSEGKLKWWMSVERLLGAWHVASCGSPLPPESHPWQKVWSVPLSQLQFRDWANTSACQHSKLYLCACQHYLFITSQKQPLLGNGSINHSITISFNQRYKSGGKKKTNNDLRKYPWYNVTWTNIWNCRHSVSSLYFHMHTENILFRCLFPLWEYKLFAGTNHSHSPNPRAELVFRLHVTAGQGLCTEAEMSVGWVGAGVRNDPAPSRGHLGRLEIRSTCCSGKF